MVDIVYSGKSPKPGDLADISQLFIPEEFYVSKDPITELKNLTKVIVDSIIDKGEAYINLKTSLAVDGSIYCPHGKEANCICKNISMLKHMESLFTDETEYRKALCNLFYPNARTDHSNDGWTHINLGPTSNTELGMMIHDGFTRKITNRELAPDFDINWLQLFAKIQQRNPYYFNYYNVDSVPAALSNAVDSFLKETGIILHYCDFDKPISYYSAVTVNTRNETKVFMDFKSVMFDVCEILYEKVHNERL